jgi:hypothetical protein
MSIGDKRVLTYQQEEYVRQLHHALLTDTVDIIPYWGQWVGDATQAFVAYSDLSNAPIFTESNPAPFLEAKPHEAIPCQAVPATGATYSAANGQSYSLSGVELHIPTGIEGLYTHQRTIVSGLQTQYYGHFVFWSGKVFSIERIETWGTLKLITILHCLEIPMQYNITPQTAYAYILTENYDYILTEDYLPIQMETA